MFTHTTGACGYVAHIVVFQLLAEWNWNKPELWVTGLNHLTWVSTVKRVHTVQCTLCSSKNEASNYRC